MSATEADIEMWEEAGRYDILETADVVQLDDGTIIGTDLWFSPRTGEDLLRCPWVRKVRNEDRYICRIYDLRPEICRNYPVSRKHRDETGCPGYWDDEKPSGGQTKPTS